MNIINAVGAPSVLFSVCTFAEVVKIRNYIMQVQGCKFDRVTGCPDRSCSCYRDNSPVRVTVIIVLFVLP